MSVAMKRLTTIEGCILFWLWLLTGWVTVPAVWAQRPMDRDGGAEYLAIFYPIKNTVLSAEVSGVIRRIYLDMGQNFKKGDPLVLLDLDYALQRKRKAKAARDFALEERKSKKALHTRKSVSTLEYAKAATDYWISEANLAIAQEQLSGCTVRAPYRGKVVKRLARENEYVTEGQPLIEIIDDSVIRVKFHLPQSLYSKIELGMRVTAAIKDTHQSFGCTITHISPVLESNTNSFQVFGEISNGDNSIRAGMTGFISIK